MAVTEVILKKKIGGLGAEADIVKVRSGYARNYLIPQDFAAPATAASKKQVEDLKRKRAEREAQELNEAQELAGKLGKLKLKFTLTAGAGQDKVFGSVTSQDIANEVAKQGFEIDRRKIELSKGIKQTGDHEVKVDLGHGISAKLGLKVEAAKADSSEEKTADKSSTADKESS